MQNRYEVVRLIGRGGMGAVYEARDHRLGHRVALKQTLAMEETLRRAFEREARVLAALHHPILPGVSDHFIEGEGQYLVMHYIPGEDLAGLMKAQGGGFPVGQVLAWAEQLLDGLEYLHSQEPPVIHRDIKPQNLKVTGRGAIILLDFGLAKGGAVEGGQSISTGHSVFGYTPHYAPLEQIQGSGTGPRSDLYALGATLYHLLTGLEPPDALARATAVLGGVPDPLRPAHEVNSQISPELSAVLARAMSPSPVQRYDSAQAMREALHNSALPASSRPTRVLEHDALPTATLPGVEVASDEATLSLPQPTVPIEETGQHSTHAPTALETPMPSPEPTPAIGQRPTSTLLPFAVAMLLFLVGSLMLLGPLREGTNSLFAGNRDGTPTEALTEFTPGGPNSNADDPALLPTKTLALAVLTLSTTPTSTESPSPVPEPSPEASPSPITPSATRPPATRTPTRISASATRADPPTATSTATSSPIPATATATATEEPPTSTATPATVACVISPSSVFEPLWEGHRELLGCPSSPVTTIPTLAEEAFEGGHAFWRSDTDQMIVVYDRSKSQGTALIEGNWQSDPAWRWDGSEPDGIGLIPPEGRVEPLRGFGFVWRTFLNAQDGPLGWALEPERGLNNTALAQRFENGLLFRGGGATIYLLLDNGRFLRR